MGCRAGIATRMFEESDPPAKDRLAGATISAPGEVAERLKALPC